MPPSLSGTELKKKWRLGRLLGSGGCAQVFEVADLRGVGGEELVAKVAPLPSGLPPAMSKGKKRKKTDQEKHADMLYYEYTLYNGYLREHGGVPKVMVVLAEHVRWAPTPLLFEKLVAGIDRVSAHALVASLIHRVNFTLQIIVGYGSGEDDV